MGTTKEEVEATLARARETVRKSRELLGEAQKQMDQTAALYREAGLTPEDVERILADPALPPEVRRQLDEIQAQWKQEVEALAERHYDADEEQRNRQEKLGALKNNLRL
jgi:hypothetical protein